jgi:pyruvate dehydrogenase E2 component (dihydrolipoamide acetyltransferase)
LHTIQLARLGQTMEEGRLVQWLRRENEPFATGDELFEVETDKAIIPVEAKRPGAIARCLIEPGQTAQVGTVLAIVADPGETLTAQQIDAAIVSPGQTAAVGQIESASGAPASERASAEPAGRLSAVPKARHIAAELGVRLETVTGSGPGGVITADDVRRAAASGRPDEVVLRKVRLTGVARAMADGVQRGWSVPQFTQIVLLDATELVRRKEADAGLTYMDLLLEGVIAAAMATPDVLSSYADGERSFYRHVEVAIATATESGLLLPVLRKAETLTVADRAAAWRKLVERARRSELTPDDMTGATIALSNLGTRGVEFGTPLLPQGLSTVVFFGELAPRALVTKAGVEARQTIYASITYDHRIIDGLSAARFTAALKSALETGSASPTP